jgi:hypothetical protein
MTKRSAGWSAAIIITTSVTGLAQEPELKPAISVCLTFSEQLAIDAPLKAAVVSEVNRVWQPLGALVSMQDESESTSVHPILVKAAHEAGREDRHRGDTAIAWVPFTAGRARNVVFVRVDRVRKLVDTFSPGMRPRALTASLMTKLLGRSLAHELGHVLLNSLAHERSGLMRARYAADDVLRDLPSAYTLNADQRQRLLALARLAAQRWTK